VLEGVTGLLHPPGSVDAIALLLQQIMSTPHMHEKMAHAAQARVEQDFTAEKVTGLLVDFYRRQLGVGEASRVNR